MSNYICVILVTYTKLMSAPISGWYTHKISTVITLPDSSSGFVAMRNMCAHQLKQKHLIFGLVWSVAYATAVARMRKRMMNDSVSHDLAI